MNSHPSGFKFGSNVVVRNGSYNENRHQGWKNQRWEEPQGFDQPSWQQPPPMRYNQQPFYDAYQDNSYGGLMVVEIDQLRNLINKMRCKYSS